ncbi:MAG: hypothetical protein P1U89_24390 [Verrucomicrobiales bacterium]|nr:hypothetical protein [Verrucomicrobiales bacterium]
MISNLPTDSLYKFISVAGVAVFVTGAILLKEAYQIETDIGVALHPIQRESDNIKLKGPIIFKLHNEIFNLLDESYIEFEAITEESKREIFLKQIENDRLRARKMETLRTGLVTDIEKISDQISELQLRIAQLALLKFWAKVIMISGIVVSTIGFYLWYTRIQKFIDIDIKKNI